MTVCYDLRFPYLFRAYAQKEAIVLFVPSAFTLIAGDAHWEVLLRARAIETGCWIVAAAQVGLHEDGRETYGHSIIVDPWGKVVLNMGLGLDATDSKILKSCDVTFVTDFPGSSFTLSLKSRFRLYFSGLI